MTTMNAPKGIRELRSVRFRALRDAIQRFRAEHPGYYLPVRSAADARLAVTDTWGQVRPEYMPYLQASPEIRKALGWEEVPA